MFCDPLVMAVMDRIIEDGGPSSVYSTAQENF